VTQPPESRSIEREAHRLIADARELMRELIEEGMDHFDRAPLSARTAEPSAPPAAPVAAAPARVLFSDGGAPQTVELPLPSSAPWGDSPTLSDVRSHLGDCTRCQLSKGRRSIVFGDGKTDADLMFIGEGPGEQEDLQGLPFVGRAGELLTQMIEKGMGIPRSEVYICNIVKCRPPGNRNPLPQEVAACRSFLDGQIDAVRPKVIVSLGKPAAGLLLDREVAITRLRGSWQQYRGIPLMPTLHPAYILRQYTPENRRNVWEDLKAALARTRE
jgi:uracil-DNA glycosylase family 4